MGKKLVPVTNGATGKMEWYTRAELAHYREHGFPNKNEIVQVYQGEVVDHIPGEPRRGDALKQAKIMTGIISRAETSKKPKKKKRGGRWPKSDPSLDDLCYG